jgi:hypothetical protein
VRHRLAVLFQQLGHLFLFSCRETEPWRLINLNRIGLNGAGLDGPIHCGLICGTVPPRRLHLGRSTGEGRAKTRPPTKRGGPAAPCSTHPPRTSDGTCPPLPPSAAAQTCSM